MGTCGRIRDEVEEAVVLLRCNREQIEKLLPCTLTLHFPPPEGSDAVVLEITKAKLKPKE